MESVPNQVPASTEQLEKKEDSEDIQPREEAITKDCSAADSQEAKGAEDQPVDGNLVNKLTSLISKHAPQKSRYITNKILHECKDRIEQLLDSPDLLEVEISKGIEASKKKRSSRRRRSKRGGKRAKRQRKTQEGGEVAEP